MGEYWGFDPCEGGAFFTSYNSLDWRRVAPIALELRKMGFPVWYDYGLEAGTSTWREQISIHIDCAHAVLLFVTKGIFERKESYVINEYEEAKEVGKVVVPVFLDTIELINIDPKYRSYVPEWKRLQCVMGVGLDAGAIARAIAGRINESKEIKFAANTVKDPAEQQKPAAQPKTQVPVSSATRLRPSVGDRVAFGSYPQSSDTPEPIVWRVLDITDGKAMMISENLLDCKKYHEVSENVTWETCTLRRWLNGEFMNRAFSADERNKLSRVKIPNPDNASYGTKGGNPTEDYVFCLSIDEANKYFGGDEDRKAKPTAVARKNGCYVSSVFGTGWWWLRSPGVNSSRAANVDSDGGIGGLGSSVHNDDFGVLPVVLARL